MGEVDVAENDPSEDESVGDDDDEWNNPKCVESFA